MPPFFILAAWITIVASLFCYASRYVSPSWVGWLPFFGLFYPVWLVLQLGLGVWCFKYKKRLFLYLLGVFLLGFGHLNAIIQYRSYPQTRSTAIRHSFTLLSHNVEENLSVGYQFNTQKDKTLSKVNDELELIRRYRPQVLCLQESVWHYSVPDSVTRKLKNPFVYPYSVTKAEKALALYSDFPILRSRFFVKTNSWSNGAMYADLQLEDNIVVRVFNIHLQSNRLGTKADNFITNIDKIGEQKGRAMYKTTYYQLRTGWQLRAKQVDEIADSIAHSPYPVVVTGDFNDTPSSYSYQTLLNGKQDAFKVGGRWLSFTYNGRLPALSIDHVFASNSLPVLGFRVIRKGCSDHFPVRAEIGY